MILSHVIILLRARTNRRKNCRNKHTLFDLIWVWFNFCIFQNIRIDKNILYTKTPFTVQARAERGPSAAFIGVLGTPILCVYSGGLNLVPHLAGLAFTVRKSRAERGPGAGREVGQMRGRFWYPFWHFERLQWKRARARPGFFFHCKRGLKYGIVQNVFTKLIKLYDHNTVRNGIMMIRYYILTTFVIYILIGFSKDNNLILTAEKMQETTVIRKSLRAMTDSYNPYWIKVWSFFFIAALMKCDEKTLYTILRIWYSSPDCHNHSREHVNITKAPPPPKKKREK